MKRFPLLMSIAAVVVWLLPFVGPFAASARASVITAGDVVPGRPGTQPDLWAAGDILFVGVSGFGVLVIKNGGIVFNIDGSVGEQSGSTGVATVTGSGSQWNNSHWLTVGSEGSGTLNVEAGGEVSNIDGFIGGGSDSTGVVTVIGSGSRWNNSDQLSVGEGGNGTLNVAAGGVVSNINGFIAGEPGTTGTATITGNGSQWNNVGGLVVGDEGTGTLNVAAGGVVSNSDDGYIGRYSGSTGEATVTGAGSKWNNSRALWVGNSGTAH